MALKWGLAAAGNIAHDFAVALKGASSTNHKIVAVAARSLDSAVEFSKKHNIPKAYQGYENLGNDPEVDVVYVSTINANHYGVTKLLLEKGKHVLCEKPFVLNEKQARRLVAIAREKKLFLMEGLWHRCFPVMKEMKKIIESGEIGDVVQIESRLGNLSMGSLDRLNKKELGGGATLTFGIYLLSFQQYVFRGLKPTKIVGNGHLNDAGVDASATSITLYPGNKTGILSVSFLVDLPQEATIFGTKGIIKMDKIWCPTTIWVNEEMKDFPFPDHPYKHEFKQPRCIGFIYEADEVRKCILEGKIESPCITHEETIQLAKFMDKIRADIGVVYTEDSKDY